ncbi:hypothetical protein Dsin_030109 [Dipteronia sinensis]|uniref:RNase H type-1 domain-containing protein n=1 Tax=Dipteronia sinensis TaxID=43782 RepID=A0AAE0DQQ8_9ROSI|nr:hypothetical protein Dsin_030109 [Dipteronia sinensis]
MGFGSIARDHTSAVLASSSQSLPVGVSLIVAEALTIHYGFMFTTDTGLLPCSLETVAQVVVSHIRSGSAPLFDVGLVISDIIYFLDCNPSCSVAFVPKKANMVAHRLAKLGLTLDINLFRIEEVLPCLAPIVMGDCPTRL